MNPPRNKSGGVWWEEQGWDQLDLDHPDTREHYP